MHCCIYPVQKPYDVATKILIPIVRRSTRGLREIKELDHVVLRKWQSRGSCLTQKRMLAPWYHTAALCGKGQLDPLCWETWAARVCRAVVTGEPEVWGAAECASLIMSAVEWVLIGVGTLLAVRRQPRWVGVDKGRLCCAVRREPDLNEKPRVLVLRASPSCLLPAACP